MSRLREGTVSKNWSAPSHKHAVWSGNQTSMLSFWANPKTCLDILPMFPPDPSVFSGCSVGPKMAVCVFLPSVTAPCFHSALLNTIANILKRILLLLGLHHHWCCKTIHLSVWQCTSWPKKKHYDVLMSPQWVSCACHALKSIDKKWSPEAPNRLMNCQP